MPKEFTDCVAKGGKVKTIKMGKGKKYAHVCKDSEGWHKGETKTKKGQ
jgi:hypothetical protein